jgi:hypothetical protein
MSELLQVWNEWSGSWTDLFNALLRRKCELEPQSDNIALLALALVLASQPAHADGEKIPRSLCAVTGG